MTSQTVVPGPADLQAQSGALQTRSPNQAFDQLIAWATERHEEGHGLEHLFKQIHECGWSAHESVVALLRALPPEMREQVLAPTGTGEARHIASSGALKTYLSGVCIQAG
jgi:hypothetical protein